ncbi:MAG: hypothetical protein P1U67_03230 [Alcanivoracaceae bacterium]|nr:hypothetical protein [Alcanivoracaceae bacterium]
MQYIALILLSLFVAGCQSDQPISALDAAPKHVKTPTLNLNLYAAPASISGYHLQGDIGTESQHTRLFRYISDDQKQAIEIAIYALPGGWEQMDNERQVAGHYGQIRQSFAERMVRSGAANVLAEDESINTDPQTGTTVAQARLVGNGGKTVQQHIILLRTSDNLFVRLSMQPVINAVADMQSAHTALREFVAELEERDAQMQN